LSEYKIALQTERKKRADRAKVAWEYLEAEGNLVIYSLNGAKVLEKWLVVIDGPQTNSGKGLTFPPDPKLEWQQIHFRSEKTFFLRLPIALATQGNLHRGCP